MEESIIYKNKAKEQLTEAYGRICYTYTAHHKEADCLIFYDKAIRIIQILLTSISTTGFLATVITSKIVLCWIAGITVVFSLALNLYSKDFRLQTDARIHKDAADELWDIREDYVSLITDIDILSVEEILSKRSRLQERVSAVNKKYPGTSKHAYKLAQKALKLDDEQTFSVEELEKLLPISLANGNRH